MPQGKERNKNDATQRIRNRKRRFETRDNVLVHGDAEQVRANHFEGPTSRVRKPQRQHSTCTAADTSSAAAKAASRRLFLELPLRGSRSFAFQFFLEQLFLVQVGVIAAVRQKFGSACRARRSARRAAPRSDRRAARWTRGGKSGWSFVAAGSRPGASECALRFPCPRWKGNRPGSGFWDRESRRGRWRCAASGRLKA